MAIRKIVSRSIGTDVIAAEDLANNSVTVAEITDGAVTSAKMNGLTGSSSGIIQADGDGSLSTTTVDLTSRVATLGDTMTGALEIDITGDTAGALKLNAGDDSAAGSNKVQIALGYNGSQSYPHFITTRHNGGATYDNAIGFSVSDGTQSAVMGTDTKEVLRLDGTGGVLKPTNPMFQAYNGGSDFQISGQSYPFKITCFSYENFDRGSHYDASTQTFTAPVTGIYQFGIHCRLGAPGSIRVVRIALHVNGSYANDLGSMGGSSNSDAGSGYDHPPLVGTMLQQLSRNDTVELKVDGEIDSSNTLYIQNGTRSHWWGMLVG